MLEKLKILLNTDNEALLQILIDDCKQFATNYCNLDSYDTALDSIIRKMVVEDYNKRDGLGVNSRSYSGISESYTDDYSLEIYKGLKKFRKIKTL